MYPTVVFDEVSLCESPQTGPSICSVSLSLSSLSYLKKRITSPRKRHSRIIELITRPQLVNGRYDLVRFRTVTVGEF